MFNRLLYYLLNWVIIRKEKKRTRTTQTQKPSTTKRGNKIYLARNGFMLENAETPEGWTIRSGQDVITALLSFPYFQTVATGFLLEALGQALEVKKEYADIKELAVFIAENYI